MIELSKKAEENQFKSFIDSQKNFKKIESSRQVKNSDKVIVNFESLQEDLPEYLKSQNNFPIDLGFDDGILPGLNKELIEYFEKHSDPSYDLWRGGSAKSNVSNPKFWKEAWGPDWKTTF